MPDHHSNLKDSELIRQTLDGDKSAFGVLIRRYQNRLFNSMVHILRSETDAEDAVQDAFVLAFTKLSTFKGKSQLFTWLYRIAYNVAVTRMRQRKPVVSLDGKPDQSRMDFPDPGPAPDDRMHRGEQVSELNRALDRLSEEHRSILILREMDELDYDAISEILDLPIGTVRSRLHRARHQLREILEGMLDRSG
ncbi:MAG: sigma-70 family RNA polymerase sigma factor [Planctomycetota bacterium]